MFLTLKSGSCAGTQEADRGLGVLVDPLFECAFRKPLHCGLTVGLDIYRTEIGLQVNLGYGYHTDFTYI